MLLGSLTIVVFLVLLDIAILGTAIPEITSEFKALSDVGWYIGAYQLASATLQLISGKLYTHFNNKWTFMAYFAIFEIGSLLCRVASSSGVFIGDRVIAGLGSSGIVNGGMTIISGAVPLSKRPLFIGIILGIAQLGIVMAPIIGGALTEHATWRWCFYLNLPAGGAAALLLLFIKVPELAVKKPISIELVTRLLPELDPIGLALATIIGLFVGAVVLAIIFFIWELQLSDQAMLPSSLLCNRIVAFSCGFGTSLFCCMSVATNWLPTYFQAVKGEGPTMGGVYLLPLVISQLIFVIVSGAGTARIGYYLPFALMSGIMLSIGNGLISLFDAHTSTTHWIGFQIVLGIGNGLGMQMGLTAIQNAIKPGQIPVGMAFLIFSRNLGASVAVVISNIIFTQSLVAATESYAPSISPQAVLDAGSSAAAARALVSRNAIDQLVGILQSYSEALRNVFYFLVTLACLATILSLGMGWKSVSDKGMQKGVANK